MDNSVALSLQRYELAFRLYELSIAFFHLLGEDRMRDILKDYGLSFGSYIYENSELLRYRAMAREYLRRAHGLTPNYKVSIGEFKVLGKRNYRTHHLLLIYIINLNEYNTWFHKWGRYNNIYLEDKVFLQKPDSNCGYHGVRFRPWKQIAGRTRAGDLKDSSIYKYWITLNGQPTPLSKEQEIISWFVRDGTRMNFRLVYSNKEYYRLRESSKYFKKRKKRLFTGDSVRQLLKNTQLLEAAIDLGLWDVD
jgi:hypothetical protein